MLETERAWSIVERLTLARSVYSCTTGDWIAVSQLVTEKACGDRSTDLFSPENCEEQYRLLVKQVEKYPSKRRDSETLVVVKVARTLYRDRIEEIKQIIQSDNELFEVLAQELLDIRNGKRNLDEPKSTSETDLNAEPDASTIEPPDEPTSMSSKEFESGTADDQTNDADPAPSTQENISKSTPADDDADQNIENASVVDDTIPTPSEQRPDEQKTEIPKAEEDDVKDDTKQDADAKSETVEAPIISPSSLRVADDQAAERDAPETKSEIDQAEEREGSPARKKLRLSLQDDNDVDMCSDADARGNEGPSRSPSYHQKTPMSPSAYSGSSDPDVARTKRWKKLILPIWSHIANHRHGPMFLQSIKEREAPGYADAVKQPMSLAEVKKRVNSGVITRTAEFHRDILQVFSNALMYNKETSDIYRMAKELQADAQLTIKQHVQTERAVNRRDSTGPLGRRKSTSVGSDYASSVTDNEPMDAADFPTAEESTP